MSGPLRSTFTYSLPEDTDRLQPGQRLLVEFGRQRTLGYFLGETGTAPSVRIKPIIRTLDPVSYFSGELFDLCLWISDYYFANPADCLACALPPGLKSRRPSRLKWAESLPESVPAKVEAFYRPGKSINASTLSNLGRIDRVCIADLVKQGVIVEEWPVAESRVRPAILSYCASCPGRWPEFFKRRRFKPDPFEDERDRATLKSAGWTDHYLRSAMAAGLLRPVYADPADDILGFVRPRDGVTELQPNRGQRAAIDHLTERLDSGFQVSLLHGVTGSGKTLVYCHLAREVLRRERGVLVLTPEIALSGAALAYFRGFFGESVTVLHSAMTARERLESWRGLRQGRYRIAVGPRSALFAPLDNLGLVIVDEEHDSSYKQADPSPRFHGRDGAIMRAKINDVPVLLGSASPSVESYHHARSGRYDLITLDERPDGARLAQVSVIDLRSSKLHGDTPYLSFTLKQEIDRCLGIDQQAILFLNRRGYSPQLKCADCGHVPACPHCEIKLTYHKTGRRLSCHYCGYSVRAYDTCEKCAGSRFIHPGTGTQKVEEHVARLFKQGRVLRFDSDTASGRRNAHQLLHEFASGTHNLLLGTQMVTKGLDLPGVTLVGVLSADMGLDFPDFRADEKTFARLLQVAGRSGRGQEPGDVYIQTYYPESRVIQDAARQDYVGFFEREIESRRDLGFPPFGRLVRFVFASKDEAGLADATTGFASELRERTRGQSGIRLLGPADCPIPRLRGQSRRHLIVRTDRPVPFVRMLTEWEREKRRFGLPGTVRITVDVDPDDMM